MDIVGGIGQAPNGVRRVGAATSSTAKVAPAADVAVAVLDTGVDLSHRDLNVVHGYNCMNTAALANDVDGHGTHCAGELPGPRDCVHTYAASQGGLDVLAAGMLLACCKAGICLAAALRVRMLQSLGCLFHSPKVACTLVECGA